MKRVTIRILAVHNIGCEVEIDDRKYDNVLVPYANLQTGQRFEATLVNRDLLHLIHWRKKEGDE